MIDNAREAYVGVEKAQIRLRKVKVTDPSL